MTFDQAFIEFLDVSPDAVLVPITGWAVYIMGQIEKEYEALGVTESDWTAFVDAIPFNFFSIITVLLVPAALGRIDLGAMRRAEERTRGGELYWPDSKPLRLPASAPDVAGSASLVWVPLLVLFVTMFGLLAPHGFPFQQVSGSVFRTALTVSYFFAGVSLLALLSVERVLSFDKGFDIYTEGIQKMMTVAAILILAWSLGAVGRELALIFFVGAIMSFATGSSWGSFAILPPLAIPLAHSLEIALPVSIGAGSRAGSSGITLRRSPTRPSCRLRAPDRTTSITSGHSCLMRWLRRERPELRGRRCDRKPVVARVGGRAFGDIPARGRPATVGDGVSRRFGISFTQASI